MLATKNPYIDSAYQTLQVISQDEEKRLEYEAREKAIRDHNQLMLEAERRGSTHGYKKGIEQGIKQGTEQGIQAFILYNLENKVSYENLLISLQKCFNLTEEKAKVYLQKYIQ